MFIEKDTRLTEKFIGLCQEDLSVAPVSARTVYARFVAWCFEEGIPECARPSEVTFGRQTSALGVVKHRFRNGTFYVGIRLP